MQTALLGRTGIRVSRLCFGTLTVGPLQANLPVERGAQVLAEAIRQGVNFFDTAQLYGTYPYIREAMRLTGRHDIVVASKTYAYTEQLAREAVEQARRELDRDVVDIFLLHEQESALTLDGHREALDYLYTCKQKGIVRAVGASMHHIAAVDGAVDRELDVIHPLLNRDGLGIVDGGREEMERSLRRARDRGVGIYSMKPLGGGNLFRDADPCLRYVLGLDFVDSVAIGIQSEEELLADLHFWESGSFTAAQQETLRHKTRKLHIDEWCEGCGACVGVCGQRALALQSGKAVCDHPRCVLCGYCAAACPAWAIKVV